MNVTGNAVRPLYCLGVRIVIGLPVVAAPLRLPTCVCTSAPCSITVCLAGALKKPFTATITISTNSAPPATSAMYSADACPFFLLISVIYVLKFVLFKIVFTCVWVLFVGVSSFVALDLLIGGLRIPW